MLRTAPSDVTGQCAPESANDQSAAMAHTTQPNPPSSAPSPSRDDQPFRFLDLPPELRLMVYKEIYPHTRHYRLKDPVFQPNSADIPPSYITLVAKSLPVALLAICRLINAEAAPVLAPKLKKLRKEAPHFIVDSASYVSLTHEDDSIAEQVVNYGDGDFSWDPHYASRLELGSVYISKDDAGFDAVRAFVKKCAEYRAWRHGLRVVDS
jgi:hypothetical protein